MTFTEWATKYLTDRGLWPDQAEAVVAATKADEVNAVMADRWDDQIEGYPAGILVLTGMALSRSAVAWIDANKPLHFARPLFAN